MVVDPSNHTSVANCTIQCSNSELITWFVNGLPLPAFEDELHFQRYPKTPYCSQQHSMSNETHTLSILTQNQSLTLSAPLVVYCAVVTVCNKGVSNCSEHACFSDNAYLELAGSCLFILFIYCYVTMLSLLSQYHAAGEISTSISTVYSPIASEYYNHNSLTGIYRCVVHARNGTIPIAATIL